MIIELRHPLQLRDRARLAVRAAMTRPRQVALGMMAALVLAGHIGAPGSTGRDERQANVIQPSILDTIRAVKQELTFPATDVARDVSIAVARREAAIVDAGFAKTVTQAQIATVDPSVSSGSDSPELPQTIVQSQERLERPGLRSKNGETIVLSETDLARTLPSTRGPAATALAQVSDTVEIESAMMRLAREAHDRSGKPAMTAQAVSEYLSLYVLRDRVAAIGDALAREPQEAAGGVWVANLGAGLDDALFQEGFGFGNASFGAVAGADAVAQDVFSEGDRLIYGGFASAYGLSLQDGHSWAPSPAETRGGSFGVFAVLEDGRFSLSAMIRGDTAQTLNSGINRLDFSDAMQVVKAEVTARYRFDVSGWAVEPSAGLAYEAGRREVSGFGPSQSKIEDAESLQIKLGVKASGVVYNKSGTSVEPSVTIMISEELKDSGNVTFLSSAPTGPADPVSGKTVGSVSFGLDVKDESGWSGFVRAEGQVSEDDKPSAGVSAGVKAQW